MEAQVCTKYGSANVLRLVEIEKPVAKNNEVLIKILASSVTAADSMMRKGSPFIGRLFLGLLKPKKPITGTGFAGEVEAVGKDVTLFKKGDQVFGESVLGAGTNAEYVCVSDQGLLAIKPANLSFAEAAPICDGALTSLNFLSKLAKIQPGQSVLINGASGSLGTSAIQIARHLGAQVTGVCSTQNIKLVKSLGADKVIDYTKQDFTKTGISYDIIYDTIGKSSFSRCKPSLTKNGQYLSPVFGLSHLLQMLWSAKVGNKKAKFSATGILPTAELKTLLNELLQLVEQKKLTTVIDRCYSLDQLAKAHSHIDTGHKKGNIVILMK